MNRGPLASPLLAVLVAVLMACRAAESDDRAAPLLPPASTAGLVPTGDPAGLGDRGASMRNPYTDAADQSAVREGEALYRSMNCVDCHGYQGKGNMCPSLVDGEWLFGDTPADKFNSVYAGRAKGMPAYGGMLPDESIWKILTYLDDLKKRTDAVEGGAPASEGAGRDAGVENSR